MKDKYAWVMDSLSKAPLLTKARAVKHFLMNRNEYLPKKKVNADMDAVIKCALCPNMCKFDCPVLAVEKNDAVSPSGKMRLAYFIETGRINSVDAFEDMYKCTGCNACEQWCPFDFSVGDLLRGVREDISDMDMTPPNIIEIKENLERNHVMYEKKYSGNGNKYGVVNGDVLYFMGCEVSSNRNEIADSMVKIFDAAGEKYVLLEDEWCCGYPLFNLGFTEEFKKFAEHNVGAMEKSGCNVVVCSCPTCTHIFRDVYPRLGFEIKARVLHSSEYLLGLVENGKVDFTSIGKEAVYHDPCVLVRKLGLEKEPRELVKRAGMVLKEAEFGGKDTKCCGMGGGMASTNPIISSKMADARLKSLEEQLSLIVTACPTCKTAFASRGAEVLDISEVISMGMKKEKNEGHGAEKS